MPRHFQNVKLIHSKKKYDKFMSFSLKDIKDWIPDEISKSVGQEMAKEFLKAPLVQKAGIAFCIGVATLSGGPLGSAARYQLSSVEQRLEYSQESRRKARDIGIQEYKITKNREVLTQDLLTHGYEPRDAFAIVGSVSKFEDGTKNEALNTDYAVAKRRNGFQRLLGMKKFLLDGSFPNEKTIKTKNGLIVLTFPNGTTGFDAASYNGLITEKTNNPNLKLTATELKAIEFDKQNKSDKFRLTIPGNIAAIPKIIPRKLFNLGQGVKAFCSGTKQIDQNSCDNFVEEENFKTILTSPRLPSYDPETDLTTDNNLLSPLLPGSRPYDEAIERGLSARLTSLLKPTKLPNLQGMQARARALGSPTENLQLELEILPDVVSEVFSSNERPDRAHDEIISNLRRVCSQVIAQLRRDGSSDQRSETSSQVQVQESGRIQPSSKPRASFASLNSPLLTLRLRGGNTGEQFDTFDSSSKTYALESDTDFNDYVLEIDWRDFPTIDDLIHSPVAYVITLCTWIRVAFFVFKVVKKRKQRNYTFLYLPQEVQNEWIDWVLENYRTYRLDESQTSEILYRKLMFERDSIPNALRSTGREPSNDQRYSYMNSLERVYSFMARRQPLVILTGAMFISILLGNHVIFAIVFIVQTFILP